MGKGSFGEVWRAEGPGGARAALKIIPLDNPLSIRELRAVRRILRIGHAHLMPIVGIWLVDHEGQLMDNFLSSADSQRLEEATPIDDPAQLIEAMPLGDQDLATRLTECRQGGSCGIPVDELLNYLGDVAKAIDYMNAPRHDLGNGPVALHHGDIKPQNIILVGGTAQLCDFGLARVLGNSQSISTGVAGSVAYLPPEMIRDKRAHAKSDQYSLAITYVELRTGELPFAV